MKHEKTATQRFIEMLALIGVDVVAFGGDRIKFAPRSRKSLFNLFPGPWRLSALRRAVDEEKRVEHVDTR